MTNKQKQIVKVIIRNNIIYINGMTYSHNNMYDKMITKTIYGKRNDIDVYVYHFDLRNNETMMKILSRREDLIIENRSNKNINVIGLNNASVKLKRKYSVDVLNGNVICQSSYKTLRWEVIKNI